MLQTPFEYPELPYFYCDRLCFRCFSCVRVSVSRWFLNSLRLRRGILMILPSFSMLVTNILSITCPNEYTWNFLNFDWSIQSPPNNCQYLVSQKCSVDNCYQAPWAYVLVCVHLDFVCVCLCDQSLTKTEHWHHQDNHSSYMYRCWQYQCKFNNKSIYLFLWGSSLLQVFTKQKNKKQLNSNSGNELMCSFIC